MSGFDEEEDNLPEPAGFIRVAAGIVLMLSGVLLAALSEGEWMKGVGLVLFLLSPLVMLRRRDREYK